MRLVIFTVNGKTHCLHGLHSCIHLGWLCSFVHWNSYVSCACSLFCGSILRSTLRVLQPAILSVRTSADLSPTDSISTSATLQVHTSYLRFKISYSQLDTIRVYISYSYWIKKFVNSITLHFIVAHHKATNNNPLYKIFLKWLCS